MTSLKKSIRSLFLIVSAIIKPSFQLAHSDTKINEDCEA